MKKTYIAPAVVAAAFNAAPLCKDSMKLDDGTTVGGGNILTRRQMWTEEEEQ